MIAKVERAIPNQIR